MAPYRRVIPVTAAEPLKGSKEATIFLRATLGYDGPSTVARLTGPQGSAILSSCARADALLIIPPGREAINAGQQLDALLLRDEAEQSALSYEFAAVGESASAPSSRAARLVPSHLRRLSAPRPPPRPRDQAPSRLPHLAAPAPAERATKNFLLVRTWLLATGGCPSAFHGVEDDSRLPIEESGRRIGMRNQ
jgi:hypothetical protein